MVSQDGHDAVHDPELGDGDHRGRDPGESRQGVAQDRTRGMSDYQALRAQLAAAIPFARHAGAEIVEIADGTAGARLAQAEQLSNHLGSVHAGALFTLGETASGAAMVGAFADVATQIRPLATSASITYLKLGRGVLTARARTGLPGEELRRQLNAN